MNNMSDLEIQLEEELYQKLCVECINEKYCHDNADVCDKFLEELEKREEI